MKESGIESNNSQSCTILLEGVRKIAGKHSSIYRLRLPVGPPLFVGGKRVLDDVAILGIATPELFLDVLMGIPFEQELGGRSTAIRAGKVVVSRYDENFGLRSELLEHNTQEFTGSIELLCFTAEDQIAGNQQQIPGTTCILQPLQVFKESLLNDRAEALLGF